MREGLPIFFRSSHPTFPLPLPAWKRKGARGKGRVPGVLRSTGAETGTTRFHRGEERPAAQANVPRTILEIHDRTSSQAQVCDEVLRCSPLQPTPLLSDCSKPRVSAQAPRGDSWLMRQPIDSRYRPYHMMSWRPALHEKPGRSGIAVSTYMMFVGVAQSRVENTEKPFYLTLYSTYYRYLWYTTLVNFRRREGGAHDVCYYPTLQYAQQFSRLSQSSSPSS